MDNKLFNVNGRDLEMLTATLKLVFQQAGERTMAKAWEFNPNKGFVINWVADAKGANRLPAPMTAEQIAPLVMAWLESEEATIVPFERWEDDADHDGHNSKGWRVYVEDWGHVNGKWEAICAVKLCYMWHGK